MKSNWTSGIPARLGIMASVLALAIALAACGSGSAGPVTESSSAASQSEALTIKGFAFSPEDFSVQVGTTLTWTNQDSTEHTATATDGSFDTGTIRMGGKIGTVTLTDPGTYSYYCAFHPFMKGTVTVQG